MTPAERARAERKTQGLKPQVHDTGALAKVVALVRTPTPST